MKDNKYKEMMNINDSKYVEYGKYEVHNKYGRQ